MSNIKAPKSKLEVLTILKGMSKKHRAITKALVDAHMQMKRGELKEIFYSSTKLARIAKCHRSTFFRYLIKYEDCVVIRKKRYKPGTVVLSSNTYQVNNLISTVVCDLQGIRQWDDLKGKGEEFLQKLSTNEHYFSDRQKAHTYRQTEKKMRLPPPQKCDCINTLLINTQLEECTEVRSNKKLTERPGWFDRISIPEAKKLELLQLYEKGPLDRAYENMKFLMYKKKETILYPFQFLDKKAKLHTKDPWHWKRFRS